MSWYGKVEDEVNELYVSPVELTNALYVGQRSSQAAVAKSISFCALTKGVYALV